jgi:very-short-patch-repair endonuclease
VTFPFRSPNDMANARRLVQKCQSDIERKFYNVAWNRIPGLIPQCHVGSLRIDFGIPHIKVAIELDGYAYHHTKEQVAADIKRQRRLQRAGWVVIRFTGAEINSGVGLCVDEVIEIIKANCTTQTA